MSKNRDYDGASPGRRKSVAMWSIGLIAAVVVFLILAKAVSKPSTNNTASNNQPASQSLMQKLAGISEDTFAKVGQGTANPLPKPIQAPPLTKDGKPLVFYSGAEYCPYCATERWPMVIALMRFGSFSNLGTTHSASGDVFPNTQTLSFHGAGYSSQYLSFVGIENQSNQLQGTSYAPLDTPTQEQQDLIKTYDAPPYVAKESAGAIPFIDFGGKYLISGSTYGPTVLQGKSLDDIAGALNDPNSDIAKGAVGAANTITAALCTLTNNQPANVCGSEVIQGLQSKLNTGQ